jgi:hypothetical protein
LRKKERKQKKRGKKNKHENKIFELRI